MIKVGCHISIAGGIENAPGRAKELGAECFQIFSRSPHGGKAKEITKIDVHDFLNECLKFGFRANRDYIIHTPYFINLASADNRIFYGSISTIKNELETASWLKAPFVVTHIGSSKDLDGVNVQSQINKKVTGAFRKIHENYQGSSKLLLEIAAGSGNIIGDTFDEIGYFIKSAQKEGIELGFCLDTCHSFAAGYDQRTAKDVEKMFSEIDRKIGLGRIGCVHLNDSAGELGSNLDRHEHIGKGKIGQEGLKATVEQAKKLGINVYIETKHEGVVEDIGLVKGW